MLAASDALVWARVLAGVGFAVSILLLVLGLRVLGRKRLIEDVPTSKVKGVFLGLNEVKGRAVSAAPLRSFLSEVDCVHYAYAISEQWGRWETEKDSRGREHRVYRSGWVLVAKGGEAQTFGVEDDTGTVRVAPAGAEVHAAEVLDVACGPAHPLYYGKGPPGAIGDSTFARHFVEEAIPVGHALYVLGPTRLRDDVVAPEFAGDDGAEAFLISVHPEERLVGRSGLKSLLLCSFGLAIAYAAPIVLALPRRSGLEQAFRAQIFPCLAAAGAYALAALGGYLVLVYNGLARVRQRVRMARGLIDVQLQRRSDLIPRLLACVRSYAAHEIEALTEAARPRAAQLGGRDSRPEAETASAQRALFGGILALVERYPALRADAGFRLLQRELADSEDHIAFAREFYNASVTAWNIRIQTLPDLVVARLCNCRPADYLSPDAFAPSAPGAP